MADEKSKNSEVPRVQADHGSTSVGSLNVDGNVGGSVVVGNNNVTTQIINNYYQQIIEKNIEKHEPDFWALKHPYPMPPNFTGRVAERAMLNHWLSDEAGNHLFILRALGGFGKSALTWHWLTHDVNPETWTKVVFWSFYESDASFEHFIEETLKYLKLEVPQGQRPQVDELLKVMQAQKILLIMDGFERALRAYSSMNVAYQGDEEPKLEDNQLDCVNINAEIFLKSVCSLPNMKSKVLMTTRLTPRTIKPRGEFMLGCREEELTAMQKEDAVEFFHKQKIKGTRAEIEAACAPYGYHPLSLRLLAGRILKDFENPADIVVAQKLKIDGAAIQQKHHVLEVSYNNLSPEIQRLIWIISCFRTFAPYQKLKAITGNVDSFDSDIQDLIDHGLLQFDIKHKTFVLHPIVQRYIYNRMDSATKKNVHTMLLAHFTDGVQTGNVEQLNDLLTTNEFYFHMVRAGFYDEAFQFLYDHLVPNPLVYKFGAHQLVIDLLKEFFVSDDIESLVFRSHNKRTWIYNALAVSYSSTGQPKRALQLFLAGKKLDEIIGDKDELVAGLSNLAGTVQLQIGHLKDAEHNLRRCIELTQQTRNNYREMTSRQELGLILMYFGKWDESIEQITKASIISLLNGTKENIANTNYRTLFLLLSNRHINPSKDQERTLAGLIKFTQKALSELNKNTPQTIVNDFIRSYHLAGSVYRLHQSLELSDQYLLQALSISRLNNFIADEANILLDLALLRYDQKNYVEAKTLVDEALLITERCGYVLQGADVNLFLAQYALEQEKDKAKAKAYAESALKLAYCDGPPYYYKVAYEEAERMLEKLK